MLDYDGAQATFMVATQSGTDAWGTHQGLSLLGSTGWLRLDFPFAHARPTAPAAPAGSACRVRTAWTGSSTPCSASTPECLVLALPTMDAAERKQLYWFFAIALLILGAGYGLRDPWPADEPRFVLVAKQMFDGGPWLFPHRGQELYADKPPLLMWLQGYILNGVVQNTIYRMRQDVEEKINRLPLGYVDAQPRGDVQQLGAVPAPAHRRGDGAGCRHRWLPAPAPARRPSGRAALPAPCPGPWVSCSPSAHCLLAAVAFCR